MAIHERARCIDEFLKSPHRMLIGADWRDAQSGETFDVQDPATGKVIARAPKGGAADIDLAVRAARRSFEARTWRGQDSDDRAKVLWRYAELIDRHAEEIAAIDVLNNGMSMGLASGMVAATSRWLRYFAGEPGKLAGRNTSNAISGSGSDFHAYTVREPVGVAGLILAWNGPAGAFVAKVTPAITAGCSVVVKPAESTPLSAIRLGQLALEAGVPEGVINIVTGFGDAGEALASHPDVDKISFTGSTSVGKQIVRAAAGNLKRVTLELGGKSPCIVFDDADMAVAIPTAAMAIFGNTGQICFAASRLFVQRKSFDQVVDGISEIARNLKVGNGFDPDTQIGPLISEKQRQRVRGYVTAGREEGANIVVGGNDLSGAGYFFEPTVFANVASDMKLVREEIFGPVLVATPVDDVDDFLKIANDTSYGLAAGVFTTDLNKAHQVAARITAGNIWVNCYGINHPTMPFGGYKESGWGRELGDEGLDAFLETKSVFIQLG